MSTRRFQFESHIAAPADEVFDWHVRPGAFDRLQPPWERVEVVERTGGVADGGQVTLRVALGPIRRRWIAHDVIGAIHHAIMAPEVRGPVNATAPNPVTNYEFTKTLGRVLRRPTIFPMPAFAARLAFGEMADALLLASTRVEPARLLAAGYRFRFPNLEDALRHLLGRVPG